jgi:hypothetical protein
MAAFLFLFSLVSGLCAFDFSSDVIMQHQGTTAKQGKIFMSGEKIRMDEMIVITRLDKKIAWVLMPAQKMYIEQPINLNSNIVATKKLPGEIERKLIGQETIDGRIADKYLVTYKDKNGNKMIHQWICKTTGIPLKIAQIDGNDSMEFRNLKAGAQDASLFEIPSGYSKMSMQIPQ